MKTVLSICSFLLLLFVSRSVEDDTEQFWDGASTNKAMSDVGGGGGEEKKNKTDDRQTVIILQMIPSYCGGYWDRKKSFLASPAAACS